MKMIELIPMVQDEKLSENYLREKGILKTFKKCEKCGSDKLGMIRNDRWKCYSCKAEWSRRRDSILSLVRIKYSEFLICLKCFEIEMTAERCSKELNIYLKTVEDLYEAIENYMSRERRFGKTSTQIHSAEPEPTKSTVLKRVIDAISGN